MKFCPKAYKKSKSGFTTLPNIKYTFQMLPKISKFLLNWRNFAQIWSNWPQDSQIRYGTPLTALYASLRNPLNSKATRRGADQQLV